MVAVPMDSKIDIRATVEAVLEFETCLKSTSVSTTGALSNPSSLSHLLDSQRQVRGAQSVGGRRSDFASGTDPSSRKALVGATTI